MNVLVLTVVLIVASVSESFLLEENCLAVPPCECTNSFLYCVGEGLSQVPTFLPVQKTIPFLLINLNGNYIRILEANDFQVLQTTGATSIDLNLSDNNIEIIDDNAFTGIEKEVRIIYLNYNWLEYLPPALGKLINLAELEIADNYIKTFDPAIFAGFGSSLKYLDFSVDTMDEWPTNAINNLHKLDQLYVTDTLVINWTIPDNALDGVKNTLTSLRYDLFESDFSNRRLPASFCGLNRLRLLRIYITTWVTSGNILFDNCNTIMSSMESLQLSHFQNLNITKIFNIFPSLTHLNLDENFMNDFSLNEYNTGSLRTLRLGYNDFDHVPSDLNRLTSLESLSLSFNRIYSIQDTDFNALANLDFLDLSNNYIGTISQNAFAQNQKLRSLNLDANRLTTIPSMVTQLPALTIFHLSTGDDREFTCSCQSLSNLSSWKVDSLLFSNKCNVTGLAVPMLIKTYIQNNLQKCP